MSFKTHLSKYQLHAWLHTWISSLCTFRFLSCIMPAMLQFWIRQIPKKSILKEGCWRVTDISISRSSSLISLFLYYNKVLPKTSIHASRLRLKMAPYVVVLLSNTQWIFLFGGISYSVRRVPKVTSKRVLYYNSSRLENEMWHSLNRIEFLGMRGNPKLEPIIRKVSRRRSRKITLILGVVIDWWFVLYRYELCMNETLVELFKTMDYQKP